MGFVRPVAALAAAGAAAIWVAAGCSAPLVRNVPMLKPDDPHFGIEHLYTVRSAQFRRDVGHLLGPQIATGNRVDTLVNGDRIFPAMLDAIRNAKRSITFETFVYWDGELGREFADALAERARAGVATHVVLDWFGSLQNDPDLVDRMEDAGSRSSRNANEASSSRSGAASGA